MLGGVMAPTGGQAQSNPVPVFFRLKDYAMLPNGYRSHVKDCMAIGSAHGQISDERVYVRMDLLSCIFENGRVLEVPIMGQAFGEDGMNGLKGRLVSKQDQILGSALISGVLSGIGSGLAQATTTSATSALGTVTSLPNDMQSVAKAGLGTGVGKALDRLAQYQISLAERTFPVIEALPARYVDIVITKGSPLDMDIAALAPEAPSVAPARGAAPDNDRSALLRTVTGGDED
jgi:conjugal transfer pilus assembly protein TraB